MKDALKIIKGKKQGSPAKISGYTKQLTEDRDEAKAQLEPARENLTQARMDVLGGDRNEAEIEELAAAVRGLEGKIETLDLMISKLDEKYQEAVEREKQVQVNAIDKRIAELRQFITDIRPEYVRAKLTLEAYEKMLVSPLLGVGAASKEALLITGKERAACPIDVESITRGHGSIMAEIIDLKKQREQIMKGGIDHE
jgi:chromosome segregation ATPase